MVIEGEWFPCDDSVVRPVVRGEVVGPSGARVATLFLVDTGADRTVLDGDTLTALGEAPVQPGQMLGGVGGVAESVVLAGEVQLTDQGGRTIAFHGDFAAIPAPGALDMCVLGRDIMALFAVLVDEPGTRVCLVREPHRVSVELG